MNPALHRVHFFFIKPKFDDCREVGHLLQRSWAFTAEKLGIYCREVGHLLQRSWASSRVKFAGRTAGLGTAHSATYFFTRTGRTLRP